MCTNYILISYISCAGDHTLPIIKQLQDLMDIKNIGITTQWHKLGQELLNSNDIMQDIEADYPNDDNNCCRVMLENWLNKTTNASWSRVVTALTKIELNTAAYAVSKQYVRGMYIVMYYMGYYFLNQR